MLPIGKLRNNEEGRKNIVHFKMSTVEQECRAYRIRAINSDYTDEDREYLENETLATGYIQLTEGDHSDESRERKLFCHICCLDECTSDRCKLRHDNVERRREIVERIKKYGDEYDKRHLYWGALVTDTLFFRNGIICTLCCKLTAVSPVGAINNDCLKCNPKGEPLTTVKKRRDIIGDYEHHQDL